MTWTRTALLGLVGGTLVTLIAGASMLSVSTPAAIDAPPAPPAVDRETLVTDLARLRARQPRLAATGAASRNPFQFKAAPTQPLAMPPPSSPPSPAVSPLRTAPPLTLVGLAEEDGPAGRVRTAIISDAGGLHFAKIGDAVSGGYRVTAIREDAVELSGTADAAPLLLRLE
jgi:hypothetical protein